MVSGFASASASASTSTTSATLSALSAQTVVVGPGLSTGISIPDFTRCMTTGSLSSRFWTVPNGCLGRLNSALYSPMTDSLEDDVDEVAVDRLYARCERSHICYRSRVDPNELRADCVAIFLRPADTENPLSG